MHIFYIAAVAVAAFTAGDTAAAQNLPSSLNGIGLDNIAVNPEGRHGTRIDATLGDADIEIEVDLDGNVEEVEARRGGVFPASEIVSLVPEAVAANPSWPAGALLHSLDLDHDKVEIEGRDETGREFEAEFANDGRLIEMDYE